MSRRNKARRKDANAGKTRVVAPLSNGTPTASLNDPLVVQTTSESSNAVMSQEIYDKERALLLDLIKANSDQHDKAVLQLTAAALALSVTFVAQVARNPEPATKLFLGIGWITLVASIVTMLLSFVTGKIACSTQLKLLDRYFVEGKRPPQRNTFAAFTSSLNNGSCVLCLVGVVCVLIFSWCNLPFVKVDVQSPAAKVASFAGDHSVGDLTVSKSEKPLPPSPPATPLPSAPAKPSPETGFTPPPPPVRPPVKK